MITCPSGDIGLETSLASGVALVFLAGIATMSERHTEDHALRQGQETTLPRRSHSSAFVDFVTNPEPTIATSATAPAPAPTVSSMSPEDADHDPLDWSDEENLDRLVGVPGEARSRKRQKLPKGSLNPRGIAACQEFSTEAFLGK